MRRYLKGELYKFFNSHFCYFSLFVIVIYSVFANYLYWIESSPVSLLFENFIQEYLLLFLTLSLFLSSCIIADEFQFNTFNPFINLQYLKAKIILIIFYIIIIFICSLVICYDISFLFNGSFILNLAVTKNILMSFLKIMPMLILLNLFCLLLSVISKKANVSLIITYVLYLFSSYLNDLIIRRNWKIGYLFVTLNWNFNNLDLISDSVGKLSSLLICVINGITIYFLVKYFFLHRR